MKVRIVNNLGELFDFSKDEVKNATSYITADGAKLSAVTIKAPNVVGCITEAIAAVTEVAPEGDHTLYLLNGEVRTSSAGTTLYLVMGISGVLDLSERLAARSGMQKAEETIEEVVAEPTTDEIPVIDVTSDPKPDTSEENAVIVD
jgi:hypothetical protein